MRTHVILFTTLLFWGGSLFRSHEIGKHTNLPVEPWKGDTSIRSGKTLFATYCNSCHKDSGQIQAPSLGVLGSLPARSVLAAITSGKMKVQGAALTQAERKAVAEWVTQQKLSEYNYPPGSFTSFSLSTLAPLSSGWGGDLEGTGFRSQAQAGISPSNITSLHLLWAFAVPDGSIMRSKPAEVGDWIIVGTQYGEVYAIRKSTGKLGWIFRASAAIRGAISLVRDASGVRAYFADFGTNVYAVDVRTGKEIWSRRAGYDQQSSITGSVAVYDGKVYVPISSVEVASALDGNYPCCISSGGVVALDARTGNEIWRHRVLPAAKLSGKKRNGKPFYGPSGAPVWCSPTVDRKRGLLLIGTGENYSYPSMGTSDAIQALDLKTGKLIWNFQGTSGDIYNLACPVLNNCPEKPGPDLDFGMAPILMKTSKGKDILTAGQKSGVVYALDPSTGKLVWKTRIGKGGKLGGVHWGMTTDGKRIYAACADNVIALDKSDSTAQEFHGLVALDPESGKVLWKAPAPDCGGKMNCFVANSSAPASVPGLVFAGALDGHIRAYAAADGHVVWDFNTARDFETVNGIPGHGGAIDGPAPLISGGLLFMNSGYGMFGEMGGNVLLAFEVSRN